MLFYLCAGIAAVVITITFFWDNGFYLDVALGALGRCVVCFVVAFVLTGTVQILGGEYATLTRVEEPVEAIEIVAIADNNFVSCTYKDSEPEYHFMTNTEKGKVLDVLKAKHVFIIEDDSVQPHIIKYDTKWANPVLQWMFGDPTAYEYEIYVPSGSITGEFNIDLE